MQVVLLYAKSIWVKVKFWVKVMIVVKVNVCVCLHLALPDVSVGAFSELIR